MLELVNVMMWAGCALANVGFSVVVVMFILDAHSREAESWETISVGFMRRAVWLGALIGGFGVIVLAVAGVIAVWGGAA